MSSNEWLTRIRALPDEQVISEIRAAFEPVHHPGEEDADEWVVNFLLRKLDEAREW